MAQLEEHIDLVKNIRKGDTNSFELLFRRLYPGLCAYVNKFLNNMDDAEDIVQEVFFRIWKTRDSLDESKSIKSYLYTSVRNSSINLLERKKNENQYTRVMALVYTNGPLAESQHDSLVAQEIEKDFNVILGKLPDQCRKVFELSRFEGLKYHEIAERLNISIKTVETQMSRALVKIRYQLKEHLITSLLILFFINNS